MIRIRWRGCLVGIILSVVLTIALKHCVRAW